VPPFLEQFLAEGSQTHNPQRGAKEEYLVPYTGFEKIYRVPVEFSSRGDPLWYTIPEIDLQLDQRAGALEMSRSIREGVSSLSAAGRSIVLLFTPDRWRLWHGFNKDKEKFDVHDFVKAY
jgi:hypothetical protein